MNANRRKDTARKAVRTTISMPLMVFVKATERQQKRGHNNFSAYIQSLLHRDISDDHALAA